MKPKHIIEDNLLVLFCFFRISGFGLYCIECCVEKVTGLLSNFFLYIKMMLCDELELLVW